MILLILSLLASSPDECMDRKPGLSKCYGAIEYKQEGPQKWTCKSVCYARKQGEKDDGGTDASTVHGQGASQDACKADLERQAVKGCKP